MRQSYFETSSKEVYPDYSCTEYDWIGTDYKVEGNKTVCPKCNETNCIEKCI